MASVGVRPQRDQRRLAELPDGSAGCAVHGPARDADECRRAGGPLVVDEMDRPVAGDSDRRRDVVVAAVTDLQILDEGTRIGRDPAQPNTAEGSRSAGWNA